MQANYTQQALRELRPDNRNWYTWIDPAAPESYENAKSRSDDVTMPTKAEFDAKVAELKAAYDEANAPYKLARAKAYPSIADQLDQIYHEGIDAWKETIAAVKAEYPKP